MPTDDDRPAKLPTSSPDAAKEALAQADNYESIFGTVDLVLDDGTVVKIPPHPDYGMNDDDRVEAYNELLFKMDTEYDREPDIFIPEQRLKNSEGQDTGVTLPSDTQRGRLKAPYRINGVLVKPAHSIQVVICALGQEEYDRMRAGGRNASDVWKIWGNQSLKMKERQASDSKSGGSPLVVAAVPAADS